MLDSLGTDFTAYLESERTPSGKLYAVKTVQDGDQKLRTEFLPGITVDWDDEIGYDMEGNAVALEPVFAVTLYTASLEGVKAAEKVHQRLMIEPKGSTFRGLIPALLKLRGAFRQPNGQAWNPVTFRILPRGDFRDGRTATIVQTIEVRFQSLFNRSQFI